MLYNIPLYKKRVLDLRPDLLIDGIVISQTQSTKFLGGVY